MKIKGIETTHCCKICYETRLMLRPLWKVSRRKSDSARELGTWLGMWEAKAKKKRGRSEEKTTSYPRT